MDRYTEHSGYAVVLHRLIHHWVTRKLAENGELRVKKVVARLPAERTTALARFVRDNRESEVDTARNRIRGHLKQGFDTMAKAHADAIGQECRNEIAEVGRINAQPPERKRQAEAMMRDIKTRVASSLREARQKTIGLFA